MHVADDAFVQADRDTIEWVREAYADCDEADPSAYASHFAPGATLLWNGEAIEGREEVEAFFDGFFGVDVTGLEHEVTALWAVDPAEAVDEPSAAADELIAMESDVHYELPSGETVVCPATTMLERADDGIAEARIYLDPSPVYD